ncbi:class I SAM-dependent methyltransferase [candidate division KSB1 bacterium]|nr:class I SAM-dependent methyltransferase [candidate division KSB1 bacterium]
MKPGAIASKRTSTRRHWEEFWDQKQAIHEVYDNAERIVAQIKHVAGDLTGKQVLEVGAGSGRDSLMLAQAGAKVTVLDYADNSLRIIQHVFQAAPDRVALIKGDAFDLPLKSESFDVVFHQGLLEHFTDPLPILEENYRVLKSGGLLLVDVPQKFHIYTAIKHLLIATNRWFAGWETEFTMPGLMRLVQRAGFQIQHRYGEWMQPSLAYRICREILLALKIKLPRYPRGLPLIHEIRTGLHRRLMTHPLTFYTGLDIGVIGSKTKS